MECPGLKDCIDRRVKDAEQRGEVTQKLLNIEGMLVELKTDVKKVNTGMNKLYIKVAGISGGIAVVGYLFSHGK